MNLGRVCGFGLLLIGISSFAVAGVSVPEVDLGIAGSALALISGVTLIIRSRRRRT